MICTSVSHILILTNGGKRCIRETRYRSCIGNKSRVCIREIDQFAFTLSFGFAPSL